MSQLLALSFDVEASPSIFLGRDASAPSEDVGVGWGFSCYPAGGRAAAIIRDPRPVSGHGRERVLGGLDRFRSTVFVCHVRGAAKRPTEQDTHPFRISYGGRDFVFAHNGRLDPNAVRDLDLGEDPRFEPLGTTDSERIFCWLLTRMHAVGARNLRELGYDRLRRWLSDLNVDGTLNILLSDGEDIIAYQDASGFRPLHTQRLTPPHASTELSNAVMRLDYSGPLDAHRTLLLIATTPLGGGDWRPLEPGQLIVARRGNFLRADDSGASAQPSDPPMGDSAASRRKSSRPAPPIPKVGSRLYRVLHRTSYAYSEAVERSTHALRLAPTLSALQSIQAHEVNVSVDCDKRYFEDVFGNASMRLNIERPYTALEITAESMVEVCSPSVPEPRKRATIPLVWMPWQRQMMMPFLLPMELPETQLQELSGYALSFAKRQAFDVVETLDDINRSIYHDFAYVQGLTSNETTPFEVYATRQGVCQDFANLFICLARLLGIPARYRVGYIHTGADYDNHLQSEASHAWAEVYLPWVGWRGFDPTNGCRAGLDHVCVAVGRNYRDATPTSGTIYQGGGTETLRVLVEVEAVG